jgi:hypothetical protein
MSVVYSSDAKQANAPAGKPGSNIIPFSGQGRPDPRDVLYMYDEAKTLKSPYENDFRMCAAYALPRHYSGWGSDGPTMTAPNQGGAKRYAYDSTCARALPKFAAIMRRLATPDGHRWERLQASDPNLRKSYRVRAYFDELNDILFKLRYDPRATFSQAVDEMYVGLGCYGTAPVRFGWRTPKVTDRRGGFGYKAMPLKDMFFLVNADGVVDTGFHRQWMTAIQFRRKYPKWTPSRSIANELEKPNPSNTTYFEIVHAVYPRDEKTYDPDSIMVQRHPYCSHMIVVQDGEYVGPEGGYRNFPFLVPRTATEPGELYGYSPMMQAMPAAGSVNQMKRTLLRQGQKAVDPPLLASDDGILSGRVGLTPGYVNFGAVNAQGNALIHALPPGNFRPAENLLTDERADINDAFLVTLFQILVETPEMTATEVIERTSEKAALAAPAMARLQSGFLGPEVERAIEIMTEFAPRMMPEMPPELIEAQGEFEIIYTSPLAKGLHAEEDSGFMRVTEMAIEVANVTQNPEVLDPFDFDAAIPEIAEHQSVPTRWMRSPEDIEALRADRAKQQQAQQLTQAAPAIAQIAATSQKAQQPAA